MKRLLANVLGFTMCTALLAPAFTGAGLSSVAEAKSSSKSRAKSSSQAESSDENAADDDKKLPKGVIENPTDIPTLKWTNVVGPPRAAVLCIHGLGLHKETYEAFAHELNKKGIIVWAIDVRGFGEWIKRDPNNRVNYPQCFQDIKVTLQAMHREHQNMPIYIAGESMGGAIALRATAEFQDLLDGMFSSVPAGDRVHEGRMTLKVAMHALTSGFNSLMPIGTDVIAYGTDRTGTTPDDALRKTWLADPDGRNTMTPKELMQFDGLCDGNFKAAKRVTKVPVLFVQGGYDGLIVPASTTQLADAFPPENTDRHIAYSQNSEHLIFEYGNFKPEDLTYVTDWLDRHIASWNKQVGTVADATVKIDAPGQGARLSYWIELLRDGKFYRCNNKMVFKTGDEIRFHMTPSNNGYVIVMMKGSSGKTAILFPGDQTGLNNELLAGKDCVVPNQSYLKFDSTPGTEKLAVLFSREKINPNMQLYQPSTVTAYISPSADGSKDIMPTRMQLKWDDTDVVAMAPDAVASSVTKNAGVVNVVYSGSHPVMAVDIALEHQ